MTQTTIPDTSTTNGTINGTTLDAAAYDLFGLSNLSYTILDLQHHHRPHTTLLAPPPHIYSDTRVQNDYQRAVDKYNQYYGIYQTSYIKNRQSHHSHGTNSNTTPTPLTIEKWPDVGK